MDGKCVLFIMSQFVVDKWNFYFVHHLVRHPNWSFSSVCDRQNHHSVHHCSNAEMSTNTCASAVEKQLMCTLLHEIHHVSPLGCIEVLPVDQGLLVV